MSQKRKSIVYLGLPEFPQGLAEVQKAILISRSLLAGGNEVTVLCRNGTGDRSQYPGQTAMGSYENIEYIYSSGSCFRNKNFIKRRLLEIKGRMKEFSILRQKKKKK